MSNKEHLEQIAAACDEVAVFAEYLRVLALGANQQAKADRLEEQMGDQADWARIYRLAADNA